MSGPDRWPDLEPDEREFVRELATPISALAASMASCPGLDQLLAANEGVLPEPGQDAVASHLRGCPACQGLLRDALDSGLDVSAADLAHLRTRVAAARTVSAPSITWRHPALLLAAASLAGVAALGAWVGWLRVENRTLQQGAASAAEMARALEAERARAAALETRVARLEEPAVALNVPLVDLEPIGALRGGTPPVVPISRTAPFVTLVLAIAGTPAADGYTLDIRDSSDRVTWMGAGLKATQAGTVTLAVPRALLPPGSLEIRLSEAGGTVVHRYALRIQEAP